MSYGFHKIRIHVCRPGMLIPWDWFNTGVNEGWRSFPRLIQSPTINLNPNPRLLLCHLVSNLGSCYYSLKLSLYVMGSTSILHLAFQPHLCRLHVLVYNSGPRLDRELPWKTEKSLVIFAVIFNKLPPHRSIWARSPT